MDIIGDLENEENLKRLKKYRRHINAGRITLYLIVGVFIFVGIYTGATGGNDTKDMVGKVILILILAGLLLACRKWPFPIFILFSALFALFTLSMVVTTFPKEMEKDGAEVAGYLSFFVLFYGVINWLLIRATLASRKYGRIRSATDNTLLQE